MAVGVLDFYHAAGQLWKASAAYLDGRTSSARWWFELMRHRLRHGRRSLVLKGLIWALHQPQLDSCDPDRRKAVEQVSRYCQDHIEHIDYPKFEQMELPLGSGMVQSACKWLIQQRLKGVGMRWSEDGFNRLLHLRLAWANDRFDDLFGEAAAANVPSMNR